MPGVLLCCSAHQAHRGAPLTGVLLCRWANQALEGVPWVGSYSVAQCGRCLMIQPLYCSAASAGLWGERGHGDGSPPTCDSAVSPCFHGAWLSSTHISHHNLLPHIPWILLSPVNTSSRLGIALQSLNCSSQLLHLLGDLCPCPGYVWLWQGLSDSHSI